MDSLAIETKEYFQKSVGNTYFASKVWLNGELILELPFQYGYGDQSEFEIMEALNSIGYGDGSLNLHNFANKKGIELTILKRTKCRQKDLKSNQGWGNF